MSGLSDVITREPWMGRAACVGHDPAMWDGDGVRPDARAREAISICQTCPVRGWCLRTAEHEEKATRVSMRQGIHGGLTHTQRWARSQLKRGNCVPCVSCGRLLRPGSTTLEEHPDTIRHHADGLCVTCARVWPITVDVHPCVECGRLIRPRGVDARELPGSVTHGAGSRCIGCYQRARRNQKREETA